MSLPRLMQSKIFLLLVAWRVISVFIVQTSHVPDEYWQSLEVAHKLTFDYGYLTWEWRIGIRSYFYPFLISILYSLIQLLQFDYASILITLPRIFQALLSAYADYKFYIWSGSKFALFNLCINWYWYYCASRTLINSFETCLTIIALSEYPWKKNSENSTKFLWIVGFLCFVRPTAVVIWLPLCLYHLIKHISLITHYILIGLFFLIISTTIDIICYQRFVLTPLEFFKMNVLNNISEQYGKMHLLWYFTSGFPVLLGPNYILIIPAASRICKNYSSMHKPLLLLCTSVWTIIMYSLLAHKEFRFILPILPMIIYVINEGIIWRKISKSMKRLLILVLMFANVLPGFYFSVFHQQGGLKVMEYLRNEIENKDVSKLDILFLTTCHATPYYSYLHKNISMRFLTCEPNLEGIESYQDEMDTFFIDPMEWLEINYLAESSIKLPSHVIVYDSTIELIQPFLKYYTKITTCADSHFSEHGNFSNFVIYNHQSLT